jgi:hypothetical protein
VCTHDPVVSEMSSFSYSLDSPSALSLGNRLGHLSKYFRKSGGIVGFPTIPNCAR